MRTRTGPSTKKACAGGTPAFPGNAFAAAACRLAVLALAVGHGRPAAAHPGLHHDIDGVTKELALDPRNCDLLARRARLYRLDGQLDPSLADSEKGLTLDPAHRAALLERGLTLALLDRDAEAERDLGAFIDCEGSGGGASRAEALSVRAALRARADRLDEAIADYGASFDLMPDIEVCLALGEIRERLGQLNEAAAGYRYALERLGRSVLVTRALLRVETSRGAYDAAIAIVDGEIARASVRTDWYRRRAEVLTAAGDSAGARADLDRALDEANRTIARRPSAIHLCARARVLAALGRLAAAREDVEQARRLAPRYPEAIELEALLQVLAERTPG